MNSAENVIDWRIVSIYYDNGIKFLFYTGATMTEASAVSPEPGSNAETPQAHRRMHQSGLVTITAILIPALATVVVAFFGYLVATAKVSDIREQAKNVINNADLSPPIGTVVAYAGDLSKLPKSWMLCDGTVLPKDKFPDLYDKLNRAWGGDPVNVRLPDLQGLFLRGVDNHAGRDPDAADRRPTDKRPDAWAKGDAVGTTQDDALKDHVHSFPFHDFHMFTQAPAPGAIFGGLVDRQDGIPVVTGAVMRTGTPTSSVSTETRPKNAAVYWIIRVSL